jgi:hypothetical protein
MDELRFDHGAHLSSSQTLGRVEAGAFAVAGTALQSLKGHGLLHITGLFKDCARKRNYCTEYILEESLICRIEEPAFCNHL